MDMRMKLCNDALRAARLDIPAKIDPIRVVLKLPNTIRLMNSISRLIERNNKAWAFTVLKRLCKLKSMRRYGSLKKIQKSWKEAINYRAIQSSKIEAELARQRLLLKSVLSIQQLTRTKLWSKHLIRRNIIKRNKRATKIQALFRGYCCRGSIINDLRKKLVVLLRDWALGGSERLLSNPCKHSSYHVVCCMLRCINLLASSCIY